MDWEAFTVGLAEELANLPAGALVVILEPVETDRQRYVQFAQSSTELFAYVVVNSFLERDEVRATPRGEEVIMDAGWRCPEGMHENWWQELRWPASSRQYRDLARAIAIALRDGYRIGDISHWRYRAWNEETGDLIELPKLGLARE
ncbi:TY-Chap domain-containing protein [Actinomadura miaoliensis]|uniref:TY-Chap N-terminal domain-containing protein n=1 Tax=Actinomadura miaoliensis TaxID=430685 RepID=A0ABP7V4J5_9ACTN